MKKVKSWVDGSILDSKPSIDSLFSQVVDDKESEDA
jgi:hypothetical protein